MAPCAQKTTAGSSPPGGPRREPLRCAGVAGPAERQGRGAEGNVRVPCLSSPRVRGSCALYTTPLDRTFPLHSLILMYCSSFSICVHACQRRFSSRVALC